MISATRFIYTAILIVCFVSFQRNSANAQSIKLKAGSHQPWAGGMCCRYGHTYDIQLEIIQEKSPVVLDSMWLNGSCINISKYNPKKFHPWETVKISIIENLVFNDHNYNEGCYDPNKSGISFSYYVKGKRKLMDLTPYINELEFIGYP
jgi:hypothetical protein